MVYKFVCPEQEPESFDLGKCAKCRFFDMSIGKTTSYHCRKQKKPSHKRDFEGGASEPPPGNPGHGGDRGGVIP